MLSLRPGSGLKTRLLHPFDEYWDRRLRVSTFGYYPARGQSEDPDFRVHYTPTPYSLCFSMLRHVGLTTSDTVVDLGCGLGRAVFAASWLGASRAIGVDIVPQLIEQAQENARARVERGKVEFHCMSAEDYPLTDATVLVMFHPFGAGTMQAVLHRAEQELKRRPCELRVAYLNPVHASVLDASSLLTRVDHWPARPRTLSRYARYAVTFWATKKV